MYFVTVLGAIFSRVDTEHHRAFFDAMEQIRSDNTAPAFNFQPIVRFIDIDTDSYNTAVAGKKIKINFFIKTSKTS